MSFYNIEKKRAITIMSSNLTHIFMVAGIIVMAIFYAIFANSAVRSVAMLENEKDEMQAVLSTMTDLEAQNFLLSQDAAKIDMGSLGLVEAKPIYIMKSGNKDGLSFNR